MEQQRIQTRKRGWIVTSIALMLLSACLMAAVTFSLAHNTRALRAVERTYEQNLYDLSDNLNNIEVNLSKLMIAPEGRFATALLTDV